jgi:HAD superfamily hydrolase (TIGR01509 family)
MLTAMAAVIFDLDGVLVDSEPFWARAYAEFVGERYAARLGADEARRFEGGRVFETVANLMTTFGDVSADDAREDAGSIAMSLVEQVSGWLRETGGPIASSVATLTALHADGARIGVATSSHMSFIDTALEVAGVRSLVDVIVSAYGLPRGKPDPLVYELACQQLRVPPEDGVAVEDSENGVRSATAAGLSCVCLWQKDVPPPAWVAAECAAVVDELTPDVVRSGLRPRRTPPTPAVGGARP